MNILSNEQLAACARFGSDLQSRAAEIAQFLGIPVEQATERLSKGFGYQHQMVNEDYRRANIPTGADGNPDPVALLNWYRTSEQYIWELTSYHLDPGFNYAGMCSGIAERLKNEGANRVLCLGDGIGDLTLTLHRAGFEAVYHDLFCSKTAAYAEHRFASTTGLGMHVAMTDAWNPSLIVENVHAPFDAIVSLDFLEHCTSVENWTRAIFAALKPGGLFCAQNAYDCGSGPDGAIPCHLAINDKYAHAAPHTEGMALWDWLLTREIGFRQESSNWYRKPI